MEKVGPEKQVWIKPEWANYYRPSNDGFNFWRYFQMTYPGVIPVTLESEHRYEKSIYNFLKEKSFTISICNTLKTISEIEFTYGYFLYKDVFVFCAEEGDYRKITFFAHPNIYIPVEDFIFFIKKEKEFQISILVKEDYGLRTEGCHMIMPPNMDLALNYGQHFVEIHNSIVEKIKQKKSSLFLFTGCPGTGKTTYIKYLSSLVKREFIYIPVSMVSSLASPDMLTFLVGKKNTVLVLEDAERAVRTREDNNDADIVSTLLNMADGILGDVLNISIIATYNAERETVDKAFLRKGRLKFEHEFGPLSLKDTNKLLEHLGLPISNKELTLADIYNISDNIGHVDKERIAIGFGATLK